MAATSRPTAPAPKTRTVEPGARLARFEAWIATLRGSRRAPRERDMVSGSLVRVSTPTMPSPSYSGNGNGNGIENALMTPLRRMINPLLQRPLRMRESLRTTPKSHTLADIIPPFFTSFTLFTRQAYFQRYFISYFEVRYF
jgi:hypothetical protein